jgi:two-component system alkaline phosphatase synthesis response regulator PhoP
MENMPKILIVDDGSNIRDLIIATLEELVENYGVHLLTAENGEEALEIIKTKKPDLVILDVMMPGMSGFDVCNMAKSVMGLKAIYIFLTAQSQQADRRRGTYAGADRYITKPFNPDELIKVVSEVLGI